MAITALPTPPIRSDPANFAARADAFLAALPAFADEANALAAAMNLNSTIDNSTSSVLIGLGAKTFVVTAGKSFQPGMYLVAADAAAPSTNSMWGQVTSYSGTSLVVNIIQIKGSGTKTSWKISQSAPGIMTAADLLNVPAGDLAATNVQSALNELDTEKAPKASPTFTGKASAGSFGTTNWTITEVGGNLYFQYGGVNKFRFDNAGNLVALANIAGYTTPA